MTDSMIDSATLAAAERLFGIQYTDTERAQMLDNLAHQIELAVRRRAVKLPNSLPPATVFDPRLPGFTMPAQSRMNIPRIAPSLPANDEDIAFAPVSHQSAWIAGGQLTSVRLTRIYLDRVRRHDPNLLSFATVTEALALAQAENADRLLAGGRWLGPLHGIPYAAKDILDTAGITTGWGAEPFANRVPETDAEVIRRLADAGGVLLRLDELSYDAYMIAERLPQRGMFDVKAPGSVGIGSAAHRSGQAIAAWRATGGSGTSAKGEPNFGRAVAADVDIRRATQPAWCTPHGSAAAVGRE